MENDPHQRSTEAEQALGHVREKRTHSVLTARTAGISTIMKQMAPSPASPSALARMKTSNPAEISPESHVTYAEDELAIDGHDPVAGSEPGLLNGAATD